MYDPLRFSANTSISSFPTASFDDCDLCEENGVAGVSDGLRLLTVVPTGQPKE